MNDPQAQSEFVLRRLSEPFRLGGYDVGPWVWVSIVVAVVVIGLAYVIWMYRRDMRSIAWPWAVLLGCLRSVVYIILAAIFLLPARVTWERSEKNGRVLMLVDVSPSVTTVSDDQPEASDSSSRPLTRIDRAATLLGGRDSRLIERLAAQNQLQVYRFGSRLDDESLTVDADTTGWTPEQWSAWLGNDLKEWILRGVSAAGRAAMSATGPWEDGKPATPEWATTWAKLPRSETLPAGLSPADAKLLGERRDKLERRIDALRQITSGTNVGESLRTLLNRESNGMVQGIILLSDGRSNLGSDAAVTEARARAKKDGIPVFTIQLGDDRPPVSIRIADLQTPDQTPPNEKFVVRADFDGEGLTDQEVTAYLDIYKPNETEPAHTLQAAVKFQPGEPPHGQAEFAVDPDDLPAELKSEVSGGKELVEGEWKLVVRTPKDKRERFAEKEHKSEPTLVQVIKKPLRILLVASGPLKDYQFVRTMFVRERDAKRAELSIFLQNDSRDGRGVQDVEPERFLSRFPGTLRVEDDPNEKLEDRYYNLAQYDLIVCFDPDWNDFTQEQLTLLQKWVDLQAGGLILIAGPVNTLQLARDEGTGKLKPLLDLFPVIPGDIVLQTGLVRRSTKLPWRLSFPGANPDMEFLKLDDDSREMLSGWREFFDGSDGSSDAPPRRGFYSIYPLKGVKPGATVIATLSDPAAMLDGKEHPFLVVQQFGKGRVAYVGSSEIWRLRQYREVFFERFWVKLGRYVSAGSRTRQHRRGVLVMGRQFVSGQYVRFEAQLFGQNLEPLPKATTARATIKAADSGERQEVELQPKQSQSDWSGWFQGRVLAGRTGDFTLELPIPASSEVLRGKFIVRASNPELDNTRPDPAALRSVAGEFREVQSRLKDRAVIEDLSRRLSGIASGADASSVEGPKLAFALSGAGVIPDFLPKVPPQVTRNRGAVTDLWDSGPTLGAASDGKPITVATLLMVLVGLLTVEWLLRKVLRLA